jgi:hypothetical protein
MQKWEKDAFPAGVNSSATALILEDYQYTDGNIKDPRNFQSEE